MFKKITAIIKKIGEAFRNMRGNTFYYGEYDVVKNTANIFHGSLYSLNQYKDLEQCPKCGSRAITKEDVFFWVDKKGNCVDIDE